MADGLLDGAASMVGSVTGAPNGLGIPEAVNTVLNDPAFQESMRHMADGITVEVMHAFGEHAAGATIDATSAGQPTDGGAAIPQLTVEALTTHLDQMIENAHAMISTGNADQQQQGQAQLQQATDAMNTILHNIDDVQKHIIENIQGNAESPPDAPVVAVTDHEVGHGTAIADHDVSVNHPADQPVATHSHDDTTASDPSAAT